MSGATGFASNEPEWFRRNKYDSAPRFDIDIEAEPLRQILLSGGNPEKNRNLLRDLYNEIPEIRERLSVLLKEENEAYRRNHA